MMPKAEKHQAGTGRDWTEKEIARLLEWGAAAKHPPFELLAIQFGRTAQAVRLKLLRLRRKGRRR